MRKRIGCLALCLMLLVQMPLFAFAQADSKQIEAAFHAPGETSEFVWQFPYADAFFTLDANSYHHELAQSSIGLAVSAFRKCVTKLSQRDENVIHFLQSAGFSNLRCEQYDVEPTIDTIATAIGSKSIAIDGDSFTLIAVGVSGAGYQAEWDSNFSIGNSTNHIGFDHAANLVVQRIKTYIEQMAISGPTKLWITGYSRAAAVCNLTAAKVYEDNSLLIDAIYAYTFATPNTTTEAKPYPFIYNVTGQFDPVPCVPFHEWGYHRHGTTLYLPAREVNTDYVKRAQAPSDVYFQLTNRDSFWVNPEANWLLHKLCEFLVETVTSAADYAAHYQQIFIDTYNEDGTLLDRLRVLAQAIAQSDAILKELDKEKSELWVLLSQVTYDLLLEKIGWHGSSWNAAQSLSANIIHEHFPQVYVSWMMAYSTKEETFSDVTDYKRVAITGPMDVSIKISGSASPLATVKEGKITLQQGQDIPIMYVGNELLITLPSTQTYELDLLAREEGEMAYQLMEHRSGYIKGRTITFDGLKVKQGEKLMAVVLQGESSDADEGLLMDESLTVYKPTGDTAKQAIAHLDAMSDVSLQGNNTTAFLTWVLAAALLLLIFALCASLFAVHHHRQKKRKLHK